MTRGATSLAITGLVKEIAAAELRIRPFVDETPLQLSRALGEQTGATVLLKLENLQRTGSFKLRGATNKLLRLSEEERGRGVVAASSGNHGIAVAHAGSALGVAVTVFVPEEASAMKCEAMRRLGAEVRTFGRDGLESELHARAFASSSVRLYVSPYNDIDVVAGQGTIGVELRRQSPELDAIVVAVGGGGLIAGIAADLKANHPSLRVIGAVPERSPVMARSVLAGRIVGMVAEPTLSDGTAGGIESGAITFPLCQSLVDDWLEVPEEEIANAMRHARAAERQTIEGAAGVAIAGLLGRAPSLRGMRVAVVVCGANVGAETLREVLSPTG